MLKLFVFLALDKVQIAVRMRGLLGVLVFIFLGQELLLLDVLLEGKLVLQIVDKL
jgi:hypothetical protein